jgi:hypothetical protein
VSKVSRISEKDSHAAALRRKVGSRFIILFASLREKSSERLEGKKIFSHGFTRINADLRSSAKIRG